MEKNLFKTIYVAMLVATMGVIMVGCVKWDSIAFAAGEVIFSPQANLKTITKSSAELESICNDYNIKSNLTGKYTDEFFAENSLIICSFAQDASVNITVKRIEKKGKEARIIVKRTKGAGATVVGYNIHIFEVKKEDVVNITKVSVA